MSPGLDLLTLLCSGAHPAEFFKAKLDGKYFKGEEVPAWEFVRAFVDKHGALPPLDVLKTHTGSLDVPTAPLSYYLEAVEERWALGRLNAVLVDVDEVMHTDAPKAERIEKVSGALREVLDEMEVSSIRQDMAEFGAEGFDIMLANVAKIKSGVKGLLMGWPTLDNQSGGLWEGDVVSYIGRPGMGKTYKMLWTAHHAWWTQKQDVMFVSMEMPVAALVDRLAAMHAHFSITKIKKGEVATGVPGIPGLDEVEMFKGHGITAAGHPAKLWIIDGGLTATPQQVFALARYLKPRLVCIDGAYLMKNEDPRMGRWERQADNAETVKRLSGRLGVSTICSYQFSKDMAKKKKTAEEVGLEDIFGADAVAQTSSIVLGLFEGGTVNSMKTRKVRVLKGREGQTGDFYVKWEFDGNPKVGQPPMDFSECDPKTGFPIVEDDI